MKVVVAIDSMKGSLTSAEASEAAARGIRKADPYAEVAVLPVADGGEGTMRTLTESLGGNYRSLEVTGPLGTPVTARYGWIPGAGTAVIEMAEAAGLTLIPARERNPLHTTTQGVGELIRDAIAHGFRRLVIAIGGSATNDGGIGMLQALGYEFLDAEGKPIPPTAGGLEKLERISVKHADIHLKECQFLVATDVRNPLCGSNGCSAVFGPQKGADPSMIRRMDANLERYAAITAQVFPDASPDFPGAGAAGGLGFALRVFLGARLESGVEMVLRECGAERLFASADLILTGEGRLDGQTAMGKTPVGVAALAKRYGKPVAALGGSISQDASVCLNLGIDAMFPVLREAVSLKEAMDPRIASENVSAAAEQIYRLFAAGRTVGL